MLTQIRQTNNGRRSYPQKKNQIKWQIVEILVPFLWKFSHWIFVLAIQSRMWEKLTKCEAHFLRFSSKWMKSLYEKRNFHSNKTNGISFDAVFQTDLPKSILFIVRIRATTFMHKYVYSSKTRVKTLIDGIMLDDSDVKWQIIYKCTRCAAHPSTTTTRVPIETR